MKRLSLMVLALGLALLPCDVDAEQLYRYLSLDGLTTDSCQVRSDYSSSTAFKVTPGPTEVFVLERMIVYIEDGNGMQFEEYGNLNSALTNGITVLHTQDDGASTLLDLTNGITIKSNGQWARLCYDMDLKEEPGAGDDCVVVRWTFGAAGEALYIRGDRDEDFRILVHDDLTGLTEHTFMVQGYVIPVSSN